jgi:threonine dehydratase
MSVTLADIEAAAARLSGHAVVTPLLESPALNAKVGARVLIKPETLQRVGAFKFRGAWNRIAQMSAEERARGVVAFSSGNHAQGVALAAQLTGTPAVIVMPTSAPAVKVQATQGYGAQIVFYDRATENRETIAARIAGERGAILIPSYDDEAIIAGQGTVGLELARQAEALGVTLGLVATPIGGGGLMAGVSTAIRALSPGTAFWGAEPEGYDDTKLSLGAGERVGVKSAARTLCDALESPMPGALTFPVLKANLAGVAVVSDADVADGVRYAAGTLKLVVEPGGAAALAALLAGKLPKTDGAIGIVLSGGNIDPEQLARLLTEAA